MALLKQSSKAEDLPWEEHRAVDNQTLDPRSLAFSYSSRSPFGVLY
jgi:hypothetical protein